MKQAIEQFSIDRFQQNAIKGREGFEAVLEMSRRVFAEEREQQRRRRINGRSSGAGDEMMRS